MSEVRAKTLFGLIASLVVLLWAPRAQSTEPGFARTGQDLREHRETEFEVDGYFRSRGEALFNLDLDRGPTPSGRYMYLLPVGNPSSQWLTHADMRLRTDASMYALDGSMSVNLRVDILDNLSFGSTPNAVPIATDSQVPPMGDTVFQVKRAYGEVLTPVGLFTVGRMQSHWGLGLLANSGDCRDCDSGDAADRVALITPIAGMLWAAAYDLNYIGPTTERRDGLRELDLYPGDNVQTLTFAALRWRNEATRDRRRRAGKSTFDFGTYLSHRWQRYDFPNTYSARGDAAEPSPSRLVRRNYTAWALDGWARFDHPWMRLEAELAYLGATIEEPTLAPGTSVETPITSDQVGGAFESEFGRRSAKLRPGLDAGFASGDSAPGFGTYPTADSSYGAPGDLEAAQANPPADTDVDNFRFHPDYHIDQILFREIIGAVTDAYYVRPHLRWRIADVGPGRFTGFFSAVASWAVNPESPPGGERPLGIELDPSLIYEAGRFSASAHYGLFIPGSGFQNRELDRAARPAQLFKLRTMIRY